MKLKITNAFHDKYTDELYKVGQIIEVEDARGEELLASKLHLVEKVVVKKTTKAKKKA